MEDVRGALGNPQITFLDARPTERFYAQVAEPRPGLCAGHIPGSHNIPHGTIMDPSRAMRLLSETQLAERFAPCGLGQDHPSCPVIISCGSGTTACALAFAAHRLGHNLDAIKIYDGSWSEWGQQRHNNPIETT